MNILGAAQIPAPLREALARRMGVELVGKDREGYTFCECGNVTCLIKQALNENIEIAATASTAADPKDMVHGKQYVITGILPPEGTDDIEQAKLTTADEDGVRFAGQYYVGAFDAPKEERRLSFTQDYLDGIKAKLIAHYAEKAQRDGIDLEAEKQEEHEELDRDHYQKLLDVLEGLNTKCPFEKTALIELRPDMEPSNRPSRKKHIHIVLNNDVSGFMEGGEPFDMVVAMIDCDGERMIFNANSARYRLVSNERIIKLVTPKE